MRAKLNEHVYFSVSATVGFKSGQHNSQVTLNNGTTSLRGKREQRSVFGGEKEVQAKAMPTPGLYQ